MAEEIFFHNLTAFSSKKNKKDTIALYMQQTNIIYTCILGIEVFWKNIGKKGTKKEEKP
ncbi:hypothetical protein [Anaerotignum propionicum]|uniref:hypothetical protein n=1 Tax=Anaerotignum propionicum TaxID=28446 RepID=UPI002B1E988D|nr:hypothetical protein [Anaerotignum propionicum]